MLSGQGRIYKMNTYPVLEVFKSFQGEGSMMGMACNFVRFGGCNLKCSFCDTGHSWLLTNPNLVKMTSQEIIDKLDKTVPITVLTGGEPCLQPLEELIDMIHIQIPDMLVAIETNGTQPTPKNIDWVVCSPKADADYTIHGECFFNELKYVVTDEFGLDCVPEDARKPGMIWLQPCACKKKEDTQASKRRVAELVNQYPFFRAGIQLHKWYDVE